MKNLLDSKLNSLYLNLVALLVCSNVFSSEMNTYLKNADLARGQIPGGITWTVHIKTLENSKTTEMEMLVKAKDENAIAEAISPERSKGEIYLFIGNSIWFSKPSLKKPVVISARLRLSGQAVSGDIASTNYSRDYSATLEKDLGTSIVLRLKSKTSSTTYDQILYTIDKKLMVATKAEFLTVSGEIFKKAQFKYGYKLKYNGKQIPFISEVTINDANSNDQTILIYKNPKLEKHSDQIFKVNSISR